VLEDILHPQVQPTDVLILLGEDVLKLVTQLINSTYETGGWLRDLSYNDCIKEAKVTKCLQHTSTARNTEDVIGEYQFGFRRTVTRDVCGIKVHL
jgi:hypothetical protein